MARIRWTPEERAEAARWALVSLATLLLPFAAMAALVAWMVQA